MRRKICCLIVISMLILAIAPSLASVEPKNVTKRPDLGAMHLDASAVLKELGYTEENMSSAPRKLLIQITRSYLEIPELQDDGDYLLTITPDSPRAEVYLVGTDRIAPFDVDLSRSPDGKVVSSGSKDSETFCQGFLTQVSQPFLTKTGFFSQNSFTKTLLLQ